MPSTMTPPVIRKYLCHAPRPDDWEEVTMDVLRHLPNAGAAIRSSLEQLQEYHTFKTGPGRKSNAEHAICFFEYVLERIQNCKHDLPLPLVEKTIVHATHCQVCDGTGDLLQCRTCYRSFHLDCVRPCPERIDEFQCAYCVLQQETKQTKARKQAAAAVRFMARKHNQIKKEQGVAVQDQETVDDEAQETAAVDTPSGKESLASEGLATPAKNNNTHTNEPATSARSKRQRKAPLIFDPQAGPARLWQSDEKYGSAMMLSAKDASPHAPATEDEDENEDSPRQQKHIDDCHCIFCFDDPKIEVCCFCACRKCFGKHAKSQTLICDQCEDEYHLTCLDPPLRAVPDEPQWFCPTCMATKERNSSSRPTSLPKRLVESEERQTRSKATNDAPVQTRKRGRPPKQPESSPDTSTRKRGRPRSSSPDSKRARARSLSSQSEQVTRNSESTPIPVTVSRSGRTVKRGAFPDEVEEGDQHLRTTSERRQDSWDASARRVRNSPLEPSGDLPVAIPTLTMSTNAEVKIPVTSDSNAGQTVSIQAKTSEQTKNEPLPTGGGAVQPLTQAPQSTTTVCASVITSKDNLVGEVPQPTVPIASIAATQSTVVTSTVEPSVALHSTSSIGDDGSQSKTGPRRKPGARECMQISRRFGNEIIPERYVEILMDYCNRGKVEHLIRMRERLDEHARYLEAQLAGLEVQARRVGESTVRVPVATDVPQSSRAGGETAESVGE